jgi:hypothetical protein
VTVRVDVAWGNGAAVGTTGVSDGSAVGEGCAVAGCDKDVDIADGTSVGSPAVTPPPPDCAGEVSTASTAVAGSELATGAMGCVVATGAGRPPQPASRTMATKDHLILIQNFDIQYAAQVVVSRDRVVLPHCVSIVILSDQRERRISVSRSIFGEKRDSSSLRSSE